MEQAKAFEQENGEPMDDVPLGPANFINVFMFLDLEEATAKHWTILAPAHTGHDTSSLIWYAICGFEFLFVLAQLTPWGRCHETVKQITPWFIMSCTLTVAFIIAIMTDVHITIPSGCVLANFLVLMILIGTIEAQGRTPFFQFWFLRAPFSIHAGYMFCLSMQYLNVLLQVRPDNHEGVVVATSATAITAVLTMTIVFAVAIPRPDGFFCMGVAWTYYFIYYELYHTSIGEGEKLRLVLNSTVVSDEIVEAFSSATGGICFISGCLMILAFGLRLAACCQRGRI